MKIKKEQKMKILDNLKKAFSPVPLNGPGAEQAIKEKRLAAEQRAAQSSKVIALLEAKASPAGLVKTEDSLQIHSGDYDHLLPNGDGLATGGDGDPDTDNDSGPTDGNPASPENPPLPSLPEQRESTESKELVSVH
jgi:hypothetical protein